MDPEIKRKVEDTYKLAKENHRMLKAIRRNMIWASIMRIVYWLVIAGVAIGAYYFIQPIFEDAKDAYNSVIDSVNEVKEAGQKIPGIGNIFGNSN